MEFMELSYRKEDENGRGVYQKKKSRNAREKFGSDDD